jgi:hypothetical protein
VLAVDTDYTPTVQEIHLVAIHLLCAAVDACAPPLASPAGASEVPVS